MRVRSGWGNWPMPWSFFIQGPFFWPPLSSAGPANPGCGALVFFSGLSSLFYVAPPVKYGYRGLGEVSVFINMGLIMVGGSYWILSGSWDWAVLKAAVPVGFMVSNILFFQSLPDMDTDRRAGKMTLAVLSGKARATLLFKAWWAATYVGLILLNLSGQAGWFIWASLLTLPIFFQADRLLVQTDDWQQLDSHGHLIRKLYLTNGLILILSIWQTI